jgi:hypothetical protein
VSVDHGNPLLRSCFTGTGKPKRAFPTRADAREFNRRNRTSLQAYECPFHGWHLGRPGHTRKIQRQQRGGRR